MADIISESPAGFRRNPHQGDTRESGLLVLLNSGGSISCAVRRLRWPGEADVVVSVVHVQRGTVAQPMLDGQIVRRISSYLVEGDLDASPISLAANSGKSFQGMILLGLGFTFDDDAAAKGKAMSETEMRQLIESDSHNAERIFPYLGIDEVNSRPTHMHRRWCIDFNDFPLRREETLKNWVEMDERERARCRTVGLVPLDYAAPVAADWPDLLAIIQRLVKPERDVQKRDALRNRWWQYADKRPGLRTAMEGTSRVLVTGAAAVMHHMIACLDAKSIFSHKVIVFPDANGAHFSILQSRVHEIWSREFGTTFGSVDALTYNPSKVYQTFPFPNFHHARMEAAAEVYLNDRGNGMMKSVDFH